MADKPLKQLVADMRSSREAMEAVMKRLPRIIGNEAVAGVRENFRIQGYDTGKGIRKWQKRQASTNRGYKSRSGVKGSVVNSGNKLLEQTGHLRDSVHYKESGDNVTVGVDDLIVPYAKIHNEGGVINKKARTQVLHFSMRGRFASEKAKAKKNKPFYGQKVKVAAHQIKMPQRQYMPLPHDPPNQKILDKIRAKIAREINAAMKIFRK